MKLGVITGDEAFVVCEDHLNLDPVLFKNDSKDEIFGSFVDRVLFKRDWARFCNVPQSVIVKKELFSTHNAEYVWMVLGGRPCRLRTSNQGEESHSVVAETLEQLKIYMEESEPWIGADWYLVQSEVGTASGLAVCSINEQCICFLGGFAQSESEVVCIEEIRCRATTDRLSRKLQELGFVGFVEIQLRVDLESGNVWVIGCKFQLSELSRSWIINVYNQSNSQLLRTA